MTTTQAQNLGIFTNWGTFPCNSCNLPKNIEHLSEFEGFILCPTCLKTLQKAEQPNMFDIEPNLFTSID